MEIAVFHITLHDQLFRFFEILGLGAIENDLVYIAFFILRKKSEVVGVF